MQRASGRSSVCVRRASNNRDSNKSHSGSAIVGRKKFDYPARRAAICGAIHMPQPATKCRCGLRLGRVGKYAGGERCSAANDECRSFCCLINGGPFHILRRVAATVPITVQDHGRALWSMLGRTRVRERNNVVAAKRLTRMRAEIVWSTSFR